MTDRTVQDIASRSSSLKAGVWEVIRQRYTPRRDSGKRISMCTHVISCTEVGGQARQLAVHEMYSMETAIGSSAMIEFLAESSQARLNNPKPKSPLLYKQRLLLFLLLQSIMFVYSTESQLSRTMRDVSTCILPKR